MGFQFAWKAIYTVVWVASVSLFMELLGFPTQRWLTAGGLGTILLTLAGREDELFGIKKQLLQGFSPDESYPLGVPLLHSWTCNLLMRWWLLHCRIIDSGSSIQLQTAVVDKSTHTTDVLETTQQQKEL